MNTNVITKPSVRAIFVCAGLLIGGAAWSTDYVAGMGQANAAAGSLAEAPTIVMDAELHAYLHDPAIHVPDNLGNYGEDYRTLFPDRLAARDDRLPQLTSVK